SCVACANYATCLGGLTSGCFARAYHANTSCVACADYASCADYAFRSVAACEAYCLWFDDSPQPFSSSYCAVSGSSGCGVFCVPVIVFDMRARGQNFEYYPIGASYNF